MAESRGGRGNAVLTGFRLHQPATEPSASGQIPRSFRQECPWSRYPGMLCYSRMPLPPTWEQRTTGTQCQGYGWVPNGNAVTLLSHVATRPSPPPLESEASEVASCHPHPRSVQSGGQRAVSSSTSWGVETPSPGSPADWIRFRVAQVETSHCQWFYSLSKARLARMHWHTAGPRACANMCSPSEPTSTDTVQDQGGRGAGPVSGSILAQQDLVPGNSCSSRQPLSGRFL